MIRLTLFRLVALAIFLFVVYEVVSHSYMIVSTMSVLAGVAILGLLLWVGVEVLIFKMRRKS
jgi:hypothetical protein